MKIRERRILALFMAALLCAAFAGCDTTGGESSPAGEGDDSIGGTTAEPIPDTANVTIYTAVPADGLKTAYCCPTAGANGNPMDLAEAKWYELSQNGKTEMEQGGTFKADFEYECEVWFTLPYGYYTTESVCVTVEGDGALTETSVNDDKLMARIHFTCVSYGELEINVECPLPAAGKTPGELETHIYCGSASLDILGVSWCAIDGDGKQTQVNEGENFESGKIYNAYITCRMPSGAAIDSGYTITVPDGVILLAYSPVEETDTGNGVVAMLILDFETNYNHTVYISCESPANGATYGEIRTAVTLNGEAWDGYTVTWLKDGVEMAEDETFVPGCVYTARFSVKPGGENNRGFFLSCPDNCEIEFETVGNGMEPELLAELGFKDGAQLNCEMGSHDFRFDGEIAPADNEKGKKIYKCTLCGETREEEISIDGYSCE